MTKNLKQKSMLCCLAIVILILQFQIKFAVAKEFELYIDKTRIIFSEDDRLQSIGIKNKKDFPILLQAKIEPENVIDNVNFIITPPILKLDPDKQIGLTIIKVKPILDDKIEHLSYVCIKGLPPENILEKAKTKKNSVGIELNILVNACQKLIYRPSSIAKKPKDTGSYLKWSFYQNKLKAENMTPYYITFYGLSIDGLIIDNQNYIKPYGSTIFDSVKIKPLSVSWSVIEDYGGPSAEFNYNLK